MSVSNISHESHHFREVHNLDGWLKVFCLYVKTKYVVVATALLSFLTNTRTYGFQYHKCAIEVTIAIENDFKSRIEVVADITFDARLFSRSICKEDSTMGNLKI